MSENTKNAKKRIKIGDISKALLRTMDSDQKKKYLSKKEKIKYMVDDAVDLRKIPPRQQKRKPRAGTACGYIHGKNHYSLTPEGIAKRNKALKEIGARKDIFYMVDGIDIIKETIEPLNTNCGVLTKSDLNLL